MITKMMLGLFTPSFSALERVKAQSYWRQCQRIYRFQPIYRTNGQLMGIELLSGIFHPAEPKKFVSPELYFAAVSLNRRLLIVEEQIDLLRKWQPMFEQHNLLVSINVDGQVLELLQTHKNLKKKINQMPYLRFELVETAENALSIPLSQIEHSDRLWLDDFGEGIANFSSFTSWNYEYIKIARDLFILLRQSDEGVRLFYTLVTLMNRYSKGVIIEGVETEQEWAMVRNSDAMAAQGYYLSRPKTFDFLADIPIHFPD
ncbi:MAG: cyclic-guanylate-specific phosphodiesterase [Rouxiella aceris]|uniref:cyclic-guanylate-specific phosphodiesterase n=1 Tax=Rouxiella aceris TaxID=2703884 RepID=UPI00284107B3|nr:cyclic-guanylate-specific phosphodiesterase [Rouxiella aceris]MDR3431184.1 cyclic-guanylate-specific phosphodiesterase [Rouxiella aceris]